MLRIGEFSKLSQVSIRMLRYYDEEGILRPAQIDPFTGYRLYSPHQIVLAHRIVFLRDTGFSVSEIAQALSHWDQIADRLQEREKALQASIQTEQTRLAKVQTALADLEMRGKTTHFELTLRSIPRYPVLSLRRIIPNYHAEGILWKELTEYVQREGISLTQETGFAIYHDPECKDSDVDVEVCAHSTDWRERGEGFCFRVTEAVETMVCMMVTGPFENIAPAFAGLAQWLSEHDQYQMTGESRQVCHRGPWNETDPNQYLTEIQIPVISA